MRFAATITNSYHHTEYTLRVTPGKELSQHQIRRCRQRLCGMKSCHCGGALSQRGPQGWRIRWLGIDGNDNDVITVTPAQEVQA